MSALRLPATWRQPALEAIGAAIVAAALLVALTVIAARLDGAFAIALPIGVVVAAYLVLSPRVGAGLAVALLYVGLLDGYFKLSTGSEVASAGRDVVLYAVVIGVVIRSLLARGPICLPRYAGHVGLFVALVLAQALNPDTPGVRAAIGGVRQHLEFVPLFLLGYLALRTNAHLRWFFGLFIVVTVANAAVAVVQYGLTPEELASWGPGYAERVLGTGDFLGGGRTFADATGVNRVRPFGLGSDLGAAGALGGLAAAGALASLLAGKTRGVKLLGAVGVLACLVAIVTAQSRLAVLSGIFAVGCFALMSVRSREATRMVGMFALAGVLTFFVVSSLQDDAGSGSLSRLDTLSPSQIGDTLASDRGGSAAIIPRMAVQYPLGAGLGRAGPATGFGGDGSGLNAENEFNFLIGEIGTVGMLVLLALWLRIIVDGIRLTRRTVEADRRYLLAAAVTPACTTLLIWFGATPTTTSSAAPVFWVLAGALSFALGERSRGPLRDPTSNSAPTLPPLAEMTTPAVPDASVVIATRNRAASLQRCLEALDGQRGQANLEMIIVDDGSSPALRVDALRSHWPLRLLAGPGAGPAAARNVGIAAATAPIVLFTDDDTLPDPSWAQGAISGLTARPQDVGVEGPVRTPPYDPLYAYSIEAEGGGFYWTCNVAYRRAVLERLGGFDAQTFPRFREDRDLAFRAMRLGPIGYREEMAVVHTPRPITLRWVYESNRAARADPVLARRHPEHFAWGNSVPLRLQPIISAARASRIVVRAERGRPQTSLRRRLRARAIGSLTVAGAVAAMTRRGAALAKDSPAGASPSYPQLP